MTDAHQSRDILVVDRQAPQGARIDAWLADGTKLDVRRIGQRHMVFAPPGSRVVTAAMPEGIASDAWVDWYRKTPGSLPQTWLVDRSRAKQSEERVPPFVVIAAGEHAARSWLAAGASLEESAIEQNDEADVVVETGQGEAETRIEEGGILVEDGEAETGTIEHSASEPVEAGYVVADEPGIDTEIIPVGNGRIERSTGRHTLLPEEGAAFLVIRGMASGGNATVVAFHNNSWTEDRSAFMAAARSERVMKHATNEGRATVREEYMARSAALKDKAVRAEALRSEVERTQVLPDAVVGGDGTCYARTIALASGSATVKGVGESSPDKAIVLLYQGASHMYLAVDAGYCINDGDNIHLAVYADGSTRNIYGNAAERMEREARALDVKVVNVSAAKERQSNPHGPVAPAPGTDTPTDTPTHTPTDTPVEFMAPPDNEIPYSNDGPPDWGDIPDEGFSGEDMSYEEMPNEEMGGDWRAQEAPAARKPARTSPSTNSSLSAPGRGVTQGQLNIDTWAKAGERGWQWAAGVLATAADNDDELKAMGVAVAVKLIRKGFSPSKSDKGALEKALRGAVRGRVENVKIYSADTREYFVRLTPTNEWRMWGGANEPLAEKLKEAWQKEAGPVTPKVNKM